MRWAKWRGQIIEDWKTWPCYVISKTPKESLAAVYELRPPVRIMIQNIYKPSLDGYLEKIVVLNDHVKITIDSVNKKGFAEITLGPQDSIQRPKLSA